MLPAKFVFDLQFISSFPSRSLVQVLVAHPMQANRPGDKLIQMKENFLWALSEQTQDFVL